MHWGTTWKRGLSGSKPLWGSAQRLWREGEETQTQLFSDLPGRNGPWPFLYPTHCVQLLKTTPQSVPSMKWCRWLQATAWACPLALFYLLVQRRWSVLPVKGGLMYSKCLLAVVAGCIWHCAGCSCTEGSWLVSHWSSQPVLQSECSPVPSGLGAEGCQHYPLVKVLSVIHALQLFIQSVPEGFLSGNCLSPRGQQARSPQNTILHLQDKYAIRLLRIQSMWEVNLGCKKKSRHEEVLWWVTLSEAELRSVVCPERKVGRHCLAILLQR